MSRYIGCALGLTIANFAYQGITHFDWATAFDRTYFQLIAVVCLWWLDRSFTPHDCQREDSK